ncbi:LysR substrate-binding domain-containing protein, partial [Pseudoalteromonas sp. SIMBA_148]
RMPMPTSGPTISFAEALGAPLVLPPRSLHLRRRVDQAAMEAGLELNVSFEQNSAQSISSLVRAGLACTITNWPPLEDQ